MADVNSVFGFELFQKLYHDDIHKKEDVIILFVHWYLTKSGFRCIGDDIGDKVSFDNKRNVPRPVSCDNIQILYISIIFLH